ncbi:helix-turn-helix transcriptional regulator [Mucilaginibacter litoreus]|uniref:Helix-turn-helix transcriptional regulator n=1 Tax=Mucilaginibacter litoreus TaxID=1048221 RepID=A0ABW3ATK3_9SPHI
MRNKIVTFDSIIVVKDIMANDNLYSVPNILFNLAELLGTEVNNQRLEIPEKFGKGYCAGYVFNEHIRMIISDYELNADVIVVNPDVDVARKTIFFKFQNIFPTAEQALDQNPSVLIATSRINTDEIIAIHTNAATINIEVDAGYLNKLFDNTSKSPVLESLLQNTQPLLFEQVIYPSLQNTVDEIMTEPAGEAFKLFFLRIKAEELICRLLMELEKREEKSLYPLNSRDIQAIYKVKEQLIKNIYTPPNIKELTIFAGMSPTKLKRLFRQIFGNSIFNYYQELRMKEAALLLKEGKLSVSETGYKMGFTNLSHFSRVFEHHIGIKPKKYSLM